MMMKYLLLSILLIFISCSEQAIEKSKLIIPSDSLYFSCKGNMNNYIKPSIVIFILFFIFSCKEYKKEPDSQIDTTLYTKMKNGSMIYKKDWKVLKSLNKLNRSLFGKNSIHFEYSIRDNRIYLVTLSNIKPKELHKFLIVLANLSALETLILKTIDLKKFPNLIKVKHIQNLYIKYSQITGVLEIPSYLNKLKQLTITNTKISGLKFPKFCDIELLKLNNNKITSLNSTYLKLKSLKEIDLYWNLIKDVSIDLTKLPHLKKMIFCGNPILPHIQSRIQNNYPKIKFDFCPDQVEVIDGDSNTTK